MNEKAGMDVIELDNYLMNVILPKKSDVEDIPEKVCGCLFVILFLFIAPHIIYSLFILFVT